jgi:hypothetical protein
MFALALLRDCRIYVGAVAVSQFLGDTACSGSVTPMGPYDRTLWCTYPSGLYGVFQINGFAARTCSAPPPLKYLSLQYFPTSNCLGSSGQYTEVVPMNKCLSRGTTSIKFSLSVDGLSYYSSTYSDLSCSMLMTADPINTLSTTSAPNCIVGGTNPRYSSWYAYAISDLPMAAPGQVTERCVNVIISDIMVAACLN